MKAGIIHSLSKFKSIFTEHASKRQKFFLTVIAKNVTVKPYLKVKLIRNYTVLYYTSRINHREE